MARGGATDARGTDIGILPTADAGGHSSSMADGTSPAARVLDEIVAQLRRGNKIAAIKLYRTATGVGLKEARDAVEAVERAMREQDGKRALGAVEKARERARPDQGEIEVDRAKSPSFLEDVIKVLTRWRGKTN
jgi:ribosomal protein L7/L12